MIPTLRRDFHGAKLGMVPSTKIPEGELDDNTPPVIGGTTVPEPELQIIESLGGLDNSGAGRTGAHFLASMIFKPAVSLVLKVSIEASQSFRAFGEQRCRKRCPRAYRVSLGCP